MQLFTKYKKPNVPCRGKRSVIASDSGQGLIEYVILVALIALVSVTAVRSVGAVISKKMTEVKQKIQDKVEVRISPR